MSLLTAILLTYNHETTIAKAFDSILEQNTDFDFDIYVLEDYSTDKTTDICLEYKKRYSDKIRLLLNKENIGATKNLKQGLLKVKSKYFAFLEGDDYWCDPKKLQIQVDMLEKNPNCVVCAHKTLYKDNINKKEWNFPNEQKYTIKKQYALNERIRVHASSRVFKNIIDLTSIPHFMLLDADMLSLYLTKGDMLFVDSVMSVYNMSGAGYWSGKTIKQRRLINIKRRYAANKYLNFALDDRYYNRSNLLKILKLIFGVRLGWFLFYNIKVGRLHLKYLFKKKL
jgi:glycosyltransferase involved in cell wall biosynthesis